VIILGIDSSSTQSGVSVVKDGKVTEVHLFRSNKKDDLGKRLYDWGEFLRSVKAKRKVECVAVEKDSVNRNLNTIRMLSYFESVALTKAGEWGADTLLLQPSTARKHALGNGGLKKEQVYDKYKKKYKLRPYGDGGNDQSDAICVGLAADRILRGESAS
jgi:Holliday junction resolvasome RuvABC endonuclease subunit